MHAQLYSVGSAHNIVEYLGATTYTIKRSIRLYMEYWPHGDLAGLLCKHAKFDRAEKSLIFDDNDEPLPEVKIPVRALWTFFDDHGPMLYDIIFDCLKPVPQDHVTAEDLLRRIHSHIDSPLVGLPELEEDDVLEYSHDLRWAS
jgi:hypothetical protein